MGERRCTSAAPAACSKLPGSVETPSPAGVTWTLPGEAPEAESDGNPREPRGEGVGSVGSVGACGGCGCGCGGCGGWGGWGCPLANSVSSPRKLLSDFVSGDRASDLGGSACDPVANASVVP